MTKNNLKMYGGTLQIHENLRHEKRAWFVQRVSWALMALLVLLGFLGFFGEGPLSRATTPKTQKLWVEYQRFAQFESPTEIRVHVQNTVGGTDLMHIFIDKAFIDKLEVRSVVPEPEKVEVGSDHLIYSFHADAAAAPVTIRFDVEPQRIGKLKGWIASNISEPTSFSQFVYP